MMSETIEATVKTTPANVEAEQAVLGSLLIDPDAIIKVASTLRDADFYREPHQWIYRALFSLHERREPADFVTLVDELERNDQLDEIGGPAYITQLINNTPTAIYVDHYARIVERTATLRRLIGAANQIAAFAYDESHEVDEVVDRAEGISIRNVVENSLGWSQVGKNKIMSMYRDPHGGLYDMNLTFGDEIKCRIFKNGEKVFEYKSGKIETALSIIYSHVVRLCNESNDLSNVYQVQKMEKVIKIANTWKRRNE